MGLHGLPWFSHTYSNMIGLIIGFTIWFRWFWGASGQDSKLMSLGSISNISWTWHLLTLRLLESFKMMDYSVLVGTLSDWGTGEWLRQRSILSGIGYVGDVWAHPMDQFTSVNTIYFSFCCVSDLTKVSHLFSHMFIPSFFLNLYLVFGLVGHRHVPGVHFVEHDSFNDFLDPGWGDGYLVSEDCNTGTWRGPDEEWIPWMVDGP